MTKCCGTIGCSTTSLLTQCSKVLFPEGWINMIGLILLTLDGQGRTWWKRRDIRMKSCLYCSIEMVCHPIWWWMDWSNRRFVHSERSSKRQIFTQSRQSHTTHVNCRLRGKSGNWRRVMVGKWFDLVHLSGYETINWSLRPTWGHMQQWIFTCYR